MERIDEGTVAISEYGHWEHVHAYLVAGSERSLLIDTGLGVADIRSVVGGLVSYEDSTMATPQTPRMQGAIDRDLGGKVQVSVVTTHAHWDHTGGHDSFEDIAVHPADADWLEHGLPIPLEDIRTIFAREPLSKPPPEGFDPAAWRPYQGKPTRLIEDGAALDLGGRELTVLHTPGHSPGHVCLYEPATGYLFTGDLVYRGRLDAFYPSTDPVAFADSVRRLHELPHVSRVLPGHNELGLDRGDLERVHSAFEQLRQAGKLHHGSGLHQFSGFSILL